MSLEWELVECGGSIHIHHDTGEMLSCGVVAETEKMVSRGHVTPLSRDGERMPRQIHLGGLPHNLCHYIQSFIIFTRAVGEYEGKDERSYSHSSNIHNTPYSLRDAGRVKAQYTTRVPCQAH